jgi:RimJ/RimL family protein N-acetyltransferase
MIETARLCLRPLEQRDLPRLSELLNDWDVAKWLVRVPFPYTMKDAEWWFNHVQEQTRTGDILFFVLADKTDDRLRGAVGFHRYDGVKSDEMELGYWLGKSDWGQGFMSEAVAAVLPLAFAQGGLKKVTAFTDPANIASQNVLRKAGLRYLGIHPRVEKNCLRGSSTVTRWEMVRR